MAIWGSFSSIGTGCPTSPGAYVEGWGCWSIRLDRHEAVQGLDCAGLRNASSFH
jgi:hypothetical protein